MQIFSNNAKTTLDAPISNSALSLQVAAGTGALFPNPSGGDYFDLTLCKTVAGVESEIEIVRCTGRATDVLTIVRAQEGTTGQAHASGDDVSLRVTAGAMNNPRVDTITAKTSMTAPSFIGPASSAATLTTARDISCSGDASGTVSFNGSANVDIVLAIGAGKVTKAMMAPMATARLLGRTTAGSGDPEELAAAAVQTLLGLGTAAYTATGAYAPAVGSASITTLGTVTSGTWGATTIAANKGGTGQTTYAVGDVLYADSTSTLARRAAVAVGQVFLSAGVNTAPTWGALPLATAVSGILAGANGGTGVANTGKTITYGGNVTFSGAFTTTFNVAANTTLTLPSSGTLLTNASNTFTGTQTFDAAIVETPVVANTGTSYTVTDKAYHALVLTGNCTFTFPTNAAGKQFTLQLTQDGTGGRTTAWPASVRWAGGTTPTITATAGRTDLVSFVANGTYWMGVVGGQNFTLA